MPNVYSEATLQKFEDASASIPLRPLVRAFEAAGIRLGEHPDVAGGARRTQFRRYVAGVDQRNARQLAQLGHALGALIAEVATSKIEYLIGAAESDGFIFTNGILTATRSAAGLPAKSSAEHPASLAARTSQLHRLANENPRKAIEASAALITSLCRTRPDVRGAPRPTKPAKLTATVGAALDALTSPNATNGEPSPDPARDCLERLASVVTILSETRDVATPSRARLAVGAAVTFASFVSETSADLAAPGTKTTKRV